MAKEKLMTSIDEVKEWLLKQFEKVERLNMHYVENRNVFLISFTAPAKPISICTQIEFRQKSGSIAFLFLDVEKFDEKNIKFKKRKF